MANSQKEGGGFQRHDNCLSGELPKLKPYPDPYACYKMRPANLLQRGHNRDFEVHGDLETGVGGIQGAVEEFGMEYYKLNDGES